MNQQVNALFPNSGEASTFKYQDPLLVHRDAHPNSFPVCPQFPRSHPTTRIHSYPTLRTMHLPPKPHELTLPHFRRLAHLPTSQKHIFRCWACCAGYWWTGEGLCLWTVEGWWAGCGLVSAEGTGGEADAGCCLGR